MVKLLWDYVHNLNGSHFFFNFGIVDVVTIQSKEIYKTTISCFIDYPDDTLWLRLGHRDH